jgi:stage III sporulation protein AA
MITANKTPFEQATAYLCGLRPQFATLSRQITDTVCEIRLRAGRPITLEMRDKRLHLHEAVTPSQIADCVREFCGQSVHSCEKQFREGWLTLEGGHRAGFTGTAVLGGGAVTSIRDVSSVNLRIAKQYLGCADELYGRIAANLPSGLLIIGRPMSAKTTILRDLCRQIAATAKVALIDERGEIAAARAGAPSLDVGENTDVLNNFPKGEGIMSALRNLSPQWLLCDEIGGEIDAVTALTNCGVNMVLTAHAGSAREAAANRRIAALLDSGGISHIALLGHGRNIGRVEYYGDVDSFFGSNSDCCNRGGSGSGSVLFLPPEKARRIS